MAVQCTDITRLLARDAVHVAPELLGWRLVRHSPDGDVGLAIVETEAYHGIIDPASHAYRRITPRNKPMFEAGGAIYVYLSYGLHHCLNIVTGPAGEPQAVLIRAGEPIIGLDVMRQRRGTPDKQLTNGPGKIGQALSLTVLDSGSRLGDSLELIPPLEPIDNSRIVASGRIGISFGQEMPWRFYLKDNKYVSKGKHLAL